MRLERAVPERTVDVGSFSGRSGVLDLEAILRRRHKLIVANQETMIERASKGTLILAQLSLV